MVIKYAFYGSLRKLLNSKFEKLTWRKKYNILSNIVNGLANIHEMGLMHKDFHSGNIVSQTLSLSYITDFGLCKPVTENDPENIYGVIPYMAPETLSRGEYTQASDIYSFGMVMLEVLTSYPPYYNIPHNENLAMGICEGLKPEIKCEIPQFLKEIMEKCWNFEPFDRPTAKELKTQLDKYTSNDDNDEIRKHVNKQVNAANKSNKNFIQYNPNEMHPEAIYTSRHLPFLKSKKFETNTYGNYLYSLAIYE
jgi:serine/threonine protein kinase